MEALSDNSLMEKVRDGEIEKLGLLFERYKRPLYGFFYGMNHDADLSEDLVQNVFYRILRYRHLFRGDGDFKIWMFHIARNVRHDHFRKEKIKIKESVEAWQEILSDEGNQLTEIKKSEELIILSTAMEKLPEDKREILMLSKFHERKYKDIGAILGCSEGAVKVKVFRALQELKELYLQLDRRM